MSAKILFEAIGTKWQIDILQDIDSKKQEEVLGGINERIKVFDKNYSRFREDSLVMEMSKKAQGYLLPEDAKMMMDLYRDLYKITSGLITPMVGQILVDAGYDAKHSLEQKKPLEKPLSWDEVMDYKYPNLEIKKPTILDFGALGKGYLIDIVGGILIKNSINNFFIDAGGDLLHKTDSNHSIKIGLENPGDFKQVIGTVDICNKSLCGSSGSRRKWLDFHHIINPETLSSPKNIIATWTIAESTLLADAMATSIFLVSPEKLVPWYNFEYLILYSDYSIEKSSGFSAEFFN